MILRPFKKIKELEDEIYMLRKENGTLHETAERYCKKIAEQESGKHNCGAWCEGCENLIKYEFEGAYGVQRYMYCKLDYKCEDRKYGQQ